MVTHWLDSRLTLPGSPRMAQIYAYFVNVGTNGVLLFFVISGFVITRATMQREPDLFRLSYGSFYRRRLARIGPLFIAVCAFGVLLLNISVEPTALRDYVVRNPAAVFDAAFWVSLFSFTFNFWRMANAGFASGWGLHWDGMWSLAVEEQFYVAFPLLLLLAKTRRRLVLALSVLILFSVVYHLARLQSVSPYDSVIGFQLIASGMLVAVLSPALASGRGRWALYGGLLLCAGFLAPLGSLLLLLKPECIAAGASLLLCCVASVPHERPVPWLRPLARVGELSYGLYLLHPLVLYLLGTTLSGLGTVVGYGCFVVATAGLAELSSRFYEQPAERFVRSWLKKPAKSVRRRAGALIGAPD